MTALLALLVLTAHEPALNSWVMSEPANEAVRAIAPGVHAVRSDDNFVYVESAGLSLHSFGALEANQYEVPNGPRILTVKIPRHPRKAADPVYTPLGMIGLFATGVPIYNPIGSISWRDQGLWHQDAVAASRIGASALLASLTRNPAKHSPIIGYALDGFPIYGPFTDHRMRSGYRLRAIVKRDRLPDGTLLTPAQEGPPVGSNFPLGTFAEDHEYVPGLGDLDECNGTFVVTPEYPDGTYAYFLTIDEAAQPAWPYLLGVRFFGQPALDRPAQLATQRSGPVSLSTDSAEVRAGEPVHLTLRFPSRFLEKVHEQPIHLIVVSKDLTDFSHLHADPAAGGEFVFSARFARPGPYLIYADYTAPGQPPSVARFQIAVTGPPSIGFVLHEPPAVKVDLKAERPWRAGEDLPIGFVLHDPQTGGPVTDLEPWLGAWGHIIAISADGSDFIHAHPLEALTPITDPWAHTHTTPGPSPSEIRTITGFSKPGPYKIWFQFQRGGEVQTTSFDVDVQKPNAPAIARVPIKAIPITVTRTGFKPERLTTAANQPATLTFTRTDAASCAREIVFPDLGIRKDLPFNQTVVIQLPALAARELHFACGMGMFRGSLIVR